MKKFRYFILVIAGVAVMLGGCKDKEKYEVLKVIYSISEVVNVYIS